MIEKLQRAGRINVPGLGKAPPKNGLSIPNNRRRASSSAYSASCTDASFSGNTRGRRSSVASPNVGTRA